MSIGHNKPKAIDTIRTGEIIFVADDVPLQTILYSVEDVFGNQVFYTEEAEKYITNTRGSRITQKYILGYLDKIPPILRDPSIVIIDPEDATERTLVYYKEIYVREKKKQILFALIVKHKKERFVYNLHPQESGKVKFRRDRPKVIYLKSALKKSKYF